MNNFIDVAESEMKLFDFGSIPVDSEARKIVSIKNVSDNPAIYRVSSLYGLNNIDKVFRLSITSSAVLPSKYAELTIEFRPNIVGQTFTDYFVVDDTAGNNYRLYLTGKCYGPAVKLNKRKLEFRICKNVSENRREVINIVNNSAFETTYQWLLPVCGQGYFQVSTGNCGLIRAYETIATTVMFTGTSLGMYTAELVCLIMHQEPLFLDALATVIIIGNPLFNVSDHSFSKKFKKKTRSGHLMENSLTRLSYIPSASVFERFLDFGLGSVSDNTMNISQTLCVTNHEENEGYIQWMPDPDNIFMIDPIASIIPPRESRLFTVRFRPKQDNQVFGYLLCGDYQHKQMYPDEFKLKHIWFRIPCIGSTWGPCTEWPTDYDCPSEIVLPPTVPTRTAFTNFMLSNRLEIPMYFKFLPPQGTNFAIMPMCGIVQSRGWEIITVALEPKTIGEYYENWDIEINKVQKVRIRLGGSAEQSRIEVMSHGYNPATDGMYEFPPTVTGGCSHSTAYLRNLTRMEIHLRVLNSAYWLGADFGGSLLIPPKEIVRYQWWFFPKEARRVYDTTITCSCICLINGRPVGQPTEIFIHIIGYSELPDLRVLPKLNNLHDIVVGDMQKHSVTLYNYGSCYFTSKLYYVIDGMDDDHKGDRLEIANPVNSLSPSHHCQVDLTITPNGSGPRQIDIKYTVLFQNDHDEVEEIQPVEKTICFIWYDGIYPCVQVKRTISVQCPVILSNHCVWNIVNVEALNKALIDCRPKTPLNVDLYAPDLCFRTSPVEFIFVMGCVYDVPVTWSLRREKICDCEMVEVQKSISTYEMRHTCKHREMVKLTPLNGIVSQTNPGLLNLKFNYTGEAQNTLSYVLTLSNQRTLNLYFKIFAHPNARGILIPLRRPVDVPDYLTVLDCGRVPINNLDPVIRIVWLYNPTDVFTTWRLLRGNKVVSDSPIRCLLYFAEVPPLGKLAIPFSFMPTEMIDYEETFMAVGKFQQVTFSCSFGYETVKMLVKGQGGLPYCVETRLDVPLYTPKVIRAAYRSHVVHLSTEHITIPPMPTHSLSRDIIAICNNTDHIMRFIWLPERIANIVNVVMTPCWGVVQPHCTEWITMTVYTLQEPATFTTTVACEVLDLTERKKYQQNELLRRSKMEKCYQEFIITEEGMTRPDINDSPPFVLDLQKPQPQYLALTVSVCSKGQRDGCPRMLMRQIWAQSQAYDLLSSEPAETGGGGNASSSMAVADVVRIIDGILWDALHSKLFKHQITYYSREELPTHAQLVKVMETDVKPRLSRRVTSGICDAIVNKAIFHVYGLNAKNEFGVMDV